MCIYLYTHIYIYIYICIYCVRVCVYLWHVFVSVALPNLEGCMDQNMFIFLWFLNCAQAWACPRRVCWGSAEASAHHQRDACHRFCWVAEALLRLCGGLAHIAIINTYDGRRFAEAPRRLRGGSRKWKIVLNRAAEALLRLRGGPCWGSKKKKIYFN